ncbi:hypothetical protein GO013_04915 [Pseudodesulfovibrio sp. JC047]|uniref:hypothetical protein n=1 Tax=Pseudodesulfovibrio sp. JC047 TaxID=2683199 RepID=UPI0013D59894|nr:hypothetical protein [Pseudodesulfovibrio sp. JC047]NDV18759.1 hypothetical protein [Pseudodesulfovibrio sp. JC047]
MKKINWISVVGHAPLVILAVNLAVIVIMGLVFGGGEAPSDLFVPDPSLAPQAVK